MKPIPMNIAKGVALFVTLAAGVVLSFGGHADCAVTINAMYDATIANGLNPGDKAWAAKGVTQYAVALDTVIAATGVPQLLPKSKWRNLKVKAIHNGTDIFFRFDWTDSTMDVSETDAPLFADAVALEIPYNATSSSIAMGNQFEPVNILFWRANARGSAAGTGQVQNIVSGGAGTVQKSPDSDALVASQVIAYSQTRAGGSWTVIIKRPLSGTASPAGNIAALTRGKNYRITFAQWDGGNQERNGVKMVAGSWQTLFVQ